MRITRIETIPGQVPIRPELVTRGSNVVQASSPFVLLKIHTDERITAFGPPFTKSGIEIALWDILGKVANPHIYRRLGGPEVGEATIARHRIA